MLYQSVRLAAEATKTGLFTPDQVGGYLATAVIAVLTFLVSFFVLKAVVFKPMMKILNDRQKMIKDQVESAEKAGAEVDAKLEESKKIIEEARIEAAQIVSEAKENADSQANVILSQANTKASEILIKADEEVKKIKKTALEEVKDEVTDLAVEVSEKVIGEIVSKETLEELCTKHANLILDAEVGKIDANE